MSIFDRATFKPNASAMILREFISLNNEGELYYNPLYQREYVWSSEDAQNLLHRVFNRWGIGQLAIVINKHEPSKYCEMVDGRQRLTTLFDYTENKFPFIDGDKEIFFRDLDQYDQREFLKTRFSIQELCNTDETPVTDKQRVQYFYSVNFSGVPQSSEHKKKIEELLNTL